MSKPERTRYLSDEQIAQLGRINPLRGLLSVAWTWGLIAACFAAYCWRPSPWTLAIGFVVMCTQHLALVILMHEAAHCLIVRGKRGNDLIGQWLLAYPEMLNTEVYRNLHFQHHRATWKPEDPDIGLAKPFPITRRSFYRKMWRDISGQTGLKRYRFIARLSAGLSPNGRGLEGQPLLRVLRTFASRQYGFLITNAILLAVLSAAGHPEAFLLLWWLPALTGYSVVFRLRNIAEHAAVSDTQDELLHTRTTLAPFWVAFFLAPHHVNYHLEHHLFMFVPHYRLPLAHRMLEEAGVLQRAEVAPGYVDVLRRATAA